MDQFPPDDFDKENRVITQEGFDAMLDWLSPNRDEAVENYQHIQRALIKMFISRGCHIPEELFDRTRDRVIQKLPEILPSYKGDPAKYFFGVARFIWLEYLKERERSAANIPPPEPHPETRLQCLEECLEKLSADDRYELEEYHRYDDRRKMAHRIWLAKHLGTSRNGLGIDICRIKKGMRICIKKCVEEKERDRIC